MEKTHSYRTGGILSNLNEIDSRDDITSITNYDLTERAQSIVDDDVSSANNGSYLDLVPVREKEINRRYNINETSESIEIVDVHTRSKLAEDVYQDDRDNYKTHWRKELDDYDLDEGHNYLHTNGGFSDDSLKTVVHRPRPLVTLTRHECSRSVSPEKEHCHTQTRLRHESPIRELENVCRRSMSTDSTDIGRQITQLALRIESLGNISRVYQNESSPPIVQDCSCDHNHGIECLASCHEPLDVCQNSLKTARKLDKVDRLQKRQEAMQTRLTELAKKLNDSTRDLSRPIGLHENMSNAEDVHATLPPTVRKSIKKGVQRARKSAKTQNKSSSSFLKNILNDIGEAKTNEVPLLSSSYCIHNDLSTGTPNSVVTDATSKYLNEELNNIRYEFRTQVEEIRRLLSERYQQSGDSVPHSHTVDQRHESLADQIELSMSKIRRDTSPSLRNITNVSRYEDNSCPLDKYLTKRPLDYNLPSLESDITPSLRPGILPSVAKAIKSKQRMFSDPIEAERFLVELRNRRTNLENNISSLERAKEGQFLFSILEKLQGNESSFEVARIQAMVDDAIMSMNNEIQWEVKQEFSNWLERRHQHQLQQELEEEQQQCGKLKPPKCTKIVQHINYHQLPSTSAVPQKPWLCKKYWSVRSKVDTGLRKPERNVQRLYQPSSVTKSVIREGHPTCSNRRRYRTPYLHFVNDIKLAKKSIGPLGDESRRIPMIGSSRRRQETTNVVDYQRSVAPDNIVLLGVRQYSLNYDENEKVDKPRLVPRATSPKSESLTLHRPSTPPSPSLSEIGTGLNMKSRKSSKPREERVGPFSAIDPLEEPRMTSHPINVLFRQPERQRHEPDINNLRYMIERAIYDNIEIPSPMTSTDLTLSVPKATLMATPNPSERDHYSDDFGSDSPRERTEHSMTIIDGVRTPDMSRMSTDHGDIGRLDTPSVSPSRSLRMSPKRQVIQERVSEAVQTISDKANQTIEDKGMQTSSPARTQTSKENRDHVSVDSFSTTSGLEQSLSDTQVESWSDGMWLLDRSEGEMAEHYLQPVSRWNLGSCPDNPIWPHGTEDLIRNERHSSQSFGEFVRPTIPGLIPTVDGVLQLKTLPFRQRYDDENNFESLTGRETGPSNFKLISMSRDSRSKWTTPRTAHRSPSNSLNSDGEVQFGYPLGDDGDSGVTKNQRNTNNGARNSNDDSFQAIDTKRSNDSYSIDPVVHNRGEYFQSFNIRRSNDSNQTELSGPFRESYSDRMKVDPMKYLRASKQSQSDFSDTGGLMSTGQVIAAAFRGEDSANFDGYNDQFRDSHKYGTAGTYEPASRGKQTVVIPTLESIDQSERSHSDLSEIILRS